MPELLRHGMLQRQAQLDQGDRTAALLQGVLTGLAPRAAPCQQQAMLSAPPVLSRPHKVALCFAPLCPCARPDVHVKRRCLCWRSGVALVAARMQCHHTLRSSCSGCDHAQGAGAGARGEALASSGAGCWAARQAAGSGGSHGAPGHAGGGLGPDVGIAGVDRSALGTAPGASGSGAAIGGTAAGPAGRASAGDAAGSAGRAAVLSGTVYDDGGSDEAFGSAVGRAAGSAGGGAAGGGAGRAAARGGAVVGRCWVARQAAGGGGAAGGAGGASGSSAALQTTPALPSGTVPRMGGSEAAAGSAGRAGGAAAGGEAVGGSAGCDDATAALCTAMLRARGLPVPVGSASGAAADGAGGAAAGGGAAGAGRAAAHGADDGIFAHCAAVLRAQGEPVPADTALFEQAYRDGRSGRLIACASREKTMTKTCARCKLHDADLLRRPPTHVFVKAGHTCPYARVEHARQCTICEKDFTRNTTYNKTVRRPGAPGVPPPCL